MVKSSQNHHTPRSKYTFRKWFLFTFFFFKQIETPWITTTCLFMETLININIWWKILQERERGRVKGHSFWPALNLHTSIALSTQYKLILWSNKHTGCCEKGSTTDISPLEWVCIATIASTWRYCVHITLGEIERQPALLQDIYTTI